MHAYLHFRSVVLILLLIAACCCVRPARAAVVAPGPLVAAGAPAVLGDDQSTIQLLGSLPGAATRVQVVGTRAYVGGPSSLRVVDASDPTSLSLLGSSPVAVADLHVVGDVAYVAGSGGLRIVDVADAAHPLLRGSYDLPVGDGRLSHGASRVDVVGDRAYVIFQQTIVGIPPNRSELAIVDVRDRAKPALLGRYDLGPSFSDLAVVDGYAYVGGTIDVGGATGRFYNAYLAILDLRDLASPALIGSYRGSELLSGGSGGAIAVDDVIVYLGIAIGSALYALDVRDRAHPMLIGTLPIGASDLRVAGQFAYLAGMAAGLAIVDIRNPAALAQRASSGGLGMPAGVDIAGDIIYVAGDNGLRAARFLPRTTALIPASGATIETTVGRVRYDIPDGAFSDTVVLTHTLQLAADLLPAPALVRIGPAFEIATSYSATGLPAPPTSPITITVGYTDSERGPAAASTPTLYYLDGGAWVQAPGSLLDQTARSVAVPSQRMGVWALMGQARRAFLPALRR
jgi:hypothetical protein